MPQPQSKGRTSHFRGVCWHKKSRKWQAAINSSGRHVYLGSFDTEEEAARTFDKVAFKVRGHKARLNFPFSDYRNLDQELDHRLEQLVSEARAALTEKMQRMDMDGVAPLHRHNQQHDEVHTQVAGRKRRASGPAGDAQPESPVHSHSSGFDGWRHRRSTNINDAPMTVPCRSPTDMSSFTHPHHQHQQQLQALQKSLGAAARGAAATTTATALMLGPEPSCALRRSSASSGHVLGDGAPGQLTHGSLLNLAQPSRSQQPSCMLMRMSNSSGSGAGAGGIDLSMPSTTTAAEPLHAGAASGLTGFTTLSRALQAASSAPPPAAASSAPPGAGGAATQGERLRLALATVSRAIPLGGTLDFAVPSEDPDLLGYTYSVPAPLGSGSGTQYGAGVWHGTGCRDLGCYSSPADSLQACQACMSLLHETRGSASSGARRSAPGLRVVPCGLGGGAQQAGMDDSGLLQQLLLQPQFPAGGMTAARQQVAVAQQQQQPLLLGGLLQQLLLQPGMASTAALAAALQQQHQHPGLDLVSALALEGLGAAAAAAAANACSQPLASARQQAAAGLRFDARSLPRASNGGREVVSVVTQDELQAAAEGLGMLQERIKVEQMLNNLLAKH